MIEWLSRSKQKVKYEGKYNFHPVVNTQLVDSSSTISITCFTDKAQKAAVPCNYIWFSIKNSLPQEVTQFRGSTFICDTTHIGYYIQAHIFSTQPECGGKAILTFGPVELDVSLKTDILNTLAEGNLAQSIYLLDSQQEAECQLQLFQSQIKIRHSFSDLNYAFDYSILEPQMSIHPKQINKITIFFNQKYEVEMRRFQRRLFHKEDLNSNVEPIFNGKASRVSHQGSNGNYLPKFQVRFLTRAARDLFLFSMKAFVTKRQMKNWAILRKIENINFGKEEDFSAILELQSLRSDLIRYDKIYKQSLADRKRLQDQMSKMETEIQNMRAVYFNLNQGKRKDGATDKEELTSANILQLQRENNQLNFRIKGLIEEVSSMHANQFDNYMERNPFSKKKRADDTQSIAHILDNLNHSQICHFDLERDNYLKQLQSDKKQLQEKLQISLQQIDQLQKKLRNGPSASVSSSLISFSYKSCSDPQNKYELKIIEQLKRENGELRKFIQSLQHQNQRLHTQNKPIVKKLESHLSKIRQQNITTDILIESKHEQQKREKLSKQIDSLRSILTFKEGEIDTLRKQMMQFMKIRTVLEERCIQAERNRNELEIQLSALRKNRDVLNRSQNISIQMDNFNEEQIKMLKEHNCFLVEQNEKLVRACEKYMVEAKQTNKLRQEILQLKEKLTRVMTNPENSSYSLAP